MGLLKDYKGLEGLLKAWALVWPQMKSSGITLRIAGDCRLSPSQKAALIHQLKASSGVAWDFGYLSEDAFKAELQSLDLLVLPYLHCAQSGVALAALGLGVPLLVSDAGALAELLEGGQEHWTFKAGNDRALARKLLDFTQISDQRLMEYRAWIKDRAGRFGREVVVPAHLRAYGTLKPQMESVALLEEAR